MSGRNLFASIPVACLLAVGLSGIAPLANAEGVGQSVKTSKAARNNAIEAKRRFGRVRIKLPLGPTSIYYDYPYYYCRGHFPTHIGGYAYYPFHYYRCSYDWGYRGAPGTLRGYRARSN